MLEGETFILQAHEVKDGGMKIVHMYLTLYCVVAIFVGTTIGKSWFKASAS